jgi:sec-independent protein translocase protein TatA
MRQGDLKSPTTNTPRSEHVMNLGPSHLLLIGVALLIFFGPSRLPELGKSLGKGIQEFKKASKALQGDL